MSFSELFVIAIGLSMDAFAIALCKGLSVEKAEFKHFIIAGLWFGGAQALMPILGYLLGTGVSEAIQSVDHYLSFILLTFIGINMIHESREERKELNNSFSPQAMFPLAIADSIDAMAVGVTFAFSKVHILSASLIIGAVTFLLSAIGVKIGNQFGTKYKTAAEFSGGVILIAMGTVILIKDLFFHP